MHSLLSFQEYVETFIPQSIFLSLSFGFPLCLWFTSTDIYCFRWKMLVHLPLKCFWQMLPSMYSYTPREFQFWQNKGNLFVLVLQGIAIQIKANCHNFLEQGLICSVWYQEPILGMWIVVSQTHMKHKRCGCRRNKLKCHKALLTGF